ncbi:MAG TPA: DUF1648 domain-containing protein [Pirellulales bacterium]|nr:DUF1648 domain-containing protein [Pirellulales bacterium]
MTRFYWTLALVILLATAAASAIVYPKLPERMPTHWNIKGEIDGYGDKTWAAFLLPGAMLGLLALFRALPWLSPKPFTMDTFRSTFAFIVALCMATFAYFHGLMLWAGLVGPLDIGRMLLAGLCVMFTVMGNVLGKVHKNMYVGVRTPWTLASDRVWIDTHRLAARLFVGAGLAGLAVCFTTGQIVATVVTIVLIAVAALVPVVYSLVHYKRLEKRGEL